MRYAIRIAWDKDKKKEAKKLQKLARTIPTQDPNDPNYRRLWYVRYADDFLLGHIGTKAEAVEIKEKIKQYLIREIKLELNQEKTLITHAVQEKAKFLGYEIHSFHCDAKRDRRGRRGINGKIGLRVPRRVIQERKGKYMQQGKPVHLPQRINDDVFSIIAQYQAEYSGLVQYYKLAYNLSSFNRLRWVVEQSLVKTLARKLKGSVSEIYQRYKAELTTPDGTYKVLQVKLNRPGKKPLETHFGAVSLKWNPRVQLQEQQRRVWNTKSSELVERLLAQECELCGSREKIEVHHIRKLADLSRKGGPPKAEWEIIMASRRRKTLIVCQPCHKLIHFGQYDGVAIM